MTGAPDVLLEVPEEHALTGSAIASAASAVSAAVLPRGQVRYLVVTIATLHSVSSLSAT
jgi:hypothetical protein